MSQNLVADYGDRAQKKESVDFLVGRKRQINLLPDEVLEGVKDSK